MGERIKEVKVWELVGWKRFYYIKQKLCVQAKQKKELTFYFPLASRCSATSRKNRLITLRGFLWKQNPSLWIPPPPKSIFALAFIAEHGQRPFGHLASLFYLFWLYPRLVFCALPISSLAEQHEEQKSPWHCASTDLQQLKTLVCHYHYCGKKFKTEHPTNLYKEN